MVRITVIGGTGFVGNRIVQEALARDHTVTSLSRTPPRTANPDASYIVGDVQDATALRGLMRISDITISALFPRAGMEGNIAPVLRYIARSAGTIGTRLGVVGGPGTLGPDNLYPHPTTIPACVRARTPEAEETAEVLNDLRCSTAALDWFYVSPAPGVCASVPDTRTGRYRIGRDHLRRRATGSPFLTASDLAVAVIDEVENPTHRRTRFTVGY